MKLESELEKLKEADVIDAATYLRIREYYNSQKSETGNRQVIVFGILGALLVGLGLILIIAHNWDHFPKGLKLFFSFLPLLIGQIFCAFTLLKKPESRAWREGSSVFLTLAIGAAISLVSQIYQIQGNLSSFLLTWLILGLPLVYLMKSSMTNLLFIIGVTAYGLETGYDRPYSAPYNYLWLMALAIPHYIQLWRATPRSNFNYFHHWLVVGSLTLILPTFVYAPDQMIPLAYVFLFASFYLFGNRLFIQERKIVSNPFLVVGSIGSVIVLLISSFRFTWKNMDRLEIFDGSDHFSTFICLAVLLFVAAWLWWKEWTRNGTLGFRASIFLFYFLIWFSSFLGDVVPTVLSNLLLLTLSIRIIKRGLDDDHLGILNYGLLILTALVVARFFDSDMDFVIRGILFLLLGFGFFYFNYRLIKMRGKKLADHEK